MFWKLLSITLHVQRRDVIGLRMLIAYRWSKMGWYKCCFGLMLHLVVSCCVGSCHNMSRDHIDTSSALPSIHCLISHSIENDLLWIDCFIVAPLDLVPSILQIDLPILIFLSKIWGVSGDEEPRD